MAKNRNNAPDTRGRLAFGALLERVRHDTTVKRWAQIQTEFLEATSEFDTEFGSGCRKPGWYQQKAGYFNDLLILLLQNATGQTLGRSVKKGSELFSEIDIDLCYPSDGNDPIVGGEAKMLGTPPHPGNDGQARGSRADVHKRVREVALTSVDFKAHYASPRPIESFGSWIQETKPKYYSFWALRSKDDTDFVTVRAIMNSLKVYCNGVGAFFYRQRDSENPTIYVPADAPELGIDRVLREMATVIAQSKVGT